VVLRTTAGASLWTNVYGFARSLLASATALTLIFNPVSALFAPSAGAFDAPYCDSSFQRISLFCLAAPSHLGLLRWFAVLLLVAVASGYRPRVTGLIHWWVSHSFFVSASTIDGGDQATTMLSMLLLPVALTDGRKWHWDPPLPVPAGDRGAAVKRVLAMGALLMIRIQVAAIYFHAAAGKMPVREWADGTAMYYWLNHPTFGATGFLKPLISPVLVNGSTVALLTWSIIVVELFLMMGLLATRPARRVLLIAGVSMHMGILVLQGLFTFSLTMISALVLFLSPWDEPFALLSRATTAFSAAINRACKFFTRRSTIASTRAPSREARAERQ